MGQYIIYDQFYQHIHKSILGLYIMISIDYVYYILGLYIGYIYVYWVRILNKVLSAYALTVETMLFQDYATGQSANQ